MRCQHRLSSPDHSPGQCSGRHERAWGRSRGWRGTRGLSGLGVAGTGSVGARGPLAQGGSLATRAANSARLSW
jgi:hypothetical protein